MLDSNKHGFVDLKVTRWYGVSFVCLVIFVILFLYSLAGGVNENLNYDGMYVIKYVNGSISLVLFIINRGLKAIAKDLIKSTGTDRKLPF